MKNLVFSLILMISTSPPQQHLHYLALGDSYTIGESVSELERWPNQLVDSLEKQGMYFDKPTIVATTGWRTDDLRHAIEQTKLHKNYDLVSLLIGVNNQYQGKPVEEYSREFEELLETAISLAGGNKEHVFVVSIPDYGYTPFGESNQSRITAAIDDFNSINKEITERKGVAYVYITDISRNGLRQPDLVAHDNLHPSAKMYSLWVQRILRLVFPSSGK
jgi:lysophospholipase L1-like esterase